MTLPCGHLVEVAQGIGTQISRLFLHDASALSSTHINSAAPAHAPLISLPLLPASAYCFESELWLRWMSFFGHLWMELSAGQSK